MSKKIISALLICMMALCVFSVASAAKQNLRFAGTNHLGISTCLDQNTIEVLANTDELLNVKATAIVMDNKGSTEKVIEFRKEKKPGTLVQYRYDNGEWVTCPRWLGEEALKSVAPEEKYEKYHEIEFLMYFMILENILKI